jgi:hypothetical protein
MRETRNLSGFINNCCSVYRTSTGNEQKRNRTTIEKERVFFQKTEQTKKQKMNE